MREVGSDSQRALSWARRSENEPSVMRSHLGFLASALAGAGFLVVCGTLARSVLGGRELPVGALTALAGGPFFLLLLRRTQARGLRA